MPPPPADGGFTSVRGRVRSQHMAKNIRFLLFSFFSVCRGLHFLVVGSVRYIKLTHVGFRTHVKIASRIVSYLRA